MTSALDSGGQGTVFRGTFEGVPAAVKLFSAQTDERRIDREIELLSGLECDHVVRMLGHRRASLDGNELRVLAYELHNGGDLRKKISPQSPQNSADIIISVGRQIALGIEALWSRRIVHRDIKPANIVLADDGRFLVVDLGLARHLDLSDITAAGSPGTRGFRSPEQAKGRRSLTIHSDIFSLGITLALLATKTHPFGGRDIISPASITGLTRPDLPKSLVYLIREMLEFTPSKRPTDISDRFATIGEH